WVVCAGHVAWCVLFLFQAEDGIRDWSVTGVQTCALPIWIAPPRPPGGAILDAGRHGLSHHLRQGFFRRMPQPLPLDREPVLETRSEERRVGKEWRSRGVPSH